MAVQNQTPVASFTTSGVTTIFPYAFMLLDADDLVITLDGVTVSSGFSIAGIGAPAGGSVVFTAPPSAGQMLVLRRNIALQRLNDYQRNGDLLAQVLNLDLDRIWQALQGLRQDSTRALKLPEDTLTDQTITDDAAARAGKLVGFDGSGNVVAVEVSTPGALLVSAFIETLLPAASAAAARAILGAVGISGAETISGAKTYASPVTIPDGTDPAHAASVGQVSTAAAAVLRGGVRQTVLSGPVDSNGLPAFGGATGATSVTASGTLIVTAANGWNTSGALDRIGSITNPSWTGLSINGTMYLYLDVSADGSCTPVATTLAPVYQEGGTYSTTSGQFTFNTSEMVGKVGDGSAANQAYRVYVGQVTVSGGVVSAITWYALRGQYRSAWTATLPGVSTAVSRNHNIGTHPEQSELIIECTTTDAGYAAGDRIVSPLMTGAYGSNTDISVQMWANSLSTGFVTNVTNALIAPNKSSGGVVTLTAASWRYRIVSRRGW